jgi:hypothetical protein
MNKRADVDFSNPANWWLIPIVLFIGIMLIITARQFYIDTSCKDIINQRDTCCSERDAWQSYAFSLNNSINNCSNLIQEQRNICDSRITQSINDTSTKLEMSQNYITINKIFFAVYHILIIVFYLPLSINLFKIIVKIKLKKKWEELVTFLQKTWLIVKIALWIIFTLIFIAYIITFLTSNPF